MQIIVNGLISGIALGALALAFALVYLPTGVFHVALGGIYVLAPYSVWLFMAHGAPPSVAIFMTLLLACVISILIESTNHWPLAQKNASPGAHLISSLGIYLLLSQTVSLIWGDESRYLRQGLGATFSVLGVHLTLAQAMQGIVCAGLIALVIGYLSLTDSGLRLRALAANRNQFSLQGANVKRSRLVAFAISGLLCAAVSLSTANDIGFDSASGLRVTVLALVATIIGGRNSFAGGVAGGIVLGVTRAATAWFMSAKWQDAITFLLFTVFLFLIPEGRDHFSRQEQMQ
jgi:branched-chain amino acid transport system permease protein